MSQLQIPAETTIQSYTVTALQTVFPFAFAVFNKVDLHFSVDGVELTQADFTLTGTLLDGGGYQGGTITLNVGVSDCTCQAWREVAPARTENFYPASTVSVREIDSALNRAVAISQDLRRDLDEVVASTGGGVIDVLSGGTGATTATGARAKLSAAKSGVNADIIQLTGLTTALSVAQGGTGGITPVAARTALSAAASGANGDITNMTALSYVRFAGSTSGYVGLAGPAVGNNVTFTLPASDGTANQYLKTDGAGNLGFGTLTLASLGAVATSSVGVANGIASLDGSGLVPSSQLPASGSYKGTWNATTNTPTIVSSTGTNGDFYIVATAGSTSINGTASWAIGDQIRFASTVWQKVPSNAAVSSVAAKTGAVTLVVGDVSGAAASGVNSDITRLNALSTAITIAQGGTGATSAAAALTALSAAKLDFTNVSRKVDKIGASAAASSFAVARNPLTAAGQERILAGRDFGISMNGSTDDAPAINDIIQKVGARGGGIIELAPDLTPGTAAYIKTLSTINNNVNGVTLRGTHFPNSSEFRGDPLTYQSGVTIVPGFDGIACHHFTPFGSTALQVTGGGFEHLSVWGSQSGSGSSQTLLQVDGILRGSYIMSLMNPAGPACAKFVARDPAYINSVANTSIQYCHVDLYCRAGWLAGSNKAAHGVIMQTSDTFLDASAGSSGNVSLNRDWRIVFEGINGKALWNRSGDANTGFSVYAYSSGYPGVSELIWGTVGSGGTSGTYAMAFSGGTAMAGQSIVAPTGTFTVAGGKITSYTFTTNGSGYDKSLAPPTVSFAACPGLTGAAATCVIGVILYHADAMGKSKPSYLGGQSQGFDMLSGYICPIILEGANAPSAGSVLAIGNAAASGIIHANIDIGNGTPQPTVGTQAYAKTRDAVYGIDYGGMASGTVFASDQYSATLARAARSSSAPFTASSSGAGVAAEFLMQSNAIDFRLEDDSTGIIRFRDPNGVLQKVSIWAALQAIGGLEISPGVGVTYDPTANGRMTFEAVSNTQARIKVKGTDGVIRSASLALT